jgi:hypothetical protein
LFPESTHSRSNSLGWLSVDAGSAVATVDRNNKPVAMPSAIALPPIENETPQLVVSAHPRAVGGLVAMPGCDGLRLCSRLDKKKNRRHSSGFIHRSSHQQLGHEPAVARFL